MEKDSLDFLNAPDADKKFSYAGGLLTGVGAYLLGAGAMLSGVAALGGTAAVFYGIQKLWANKGPTA